MSLRTVLRQLMTESDNVTHDLYRYLAILSIITGLGLQVYSIGWKGQPFDMLAFGAGIGALAAGIGALLKLKETNEP